MEIDAEQAKAQLEELVDRVASGEEFVITVAGKAVAKLVRIRPDVPSANE